MKNRELVFKLAIPLFLILTLGLSTIWSTTPELFLSQSLFVLIGVLFMIIISRLPAQFLPVLAVPSYVLSIILLATTLIIGTVTRGSVRWIQLGTFRLQTSELVKPLLIISFAQFFSHNSQTLKWLTKQIALLLPIVLLIFVQPDLGSALIICIIWFGMLLSSRFTKKQLFTLLSIILAIIPTSWFIFQDYQKQRILSFLNPYADPAGSGYNVIQSIIAIGSGRLLGKGVRQGTQSQLKFLPERHTDFAFAAFAEEFGFIGVIILLVSFLTIFFWLLNMAKKRKPYYSLLILGVFWLFFSQFAVNVGMNLGLLPVTGITLPLVSYGGSSLVTIFISLGLAISAAKGPINT